MTDHDPKLISRLNRIEGQVRGISRMIEDGRYCVDVLTQLHAVQAALAKVEHALLKEHLERCVEAAFTGDDTDRKQSRIAELIQLLERSR